VDKEAKMQAPSAQKRPTSEFGFIKSWLKPLFGSPFNALCSIAFIWILIQILPPLISWGYTNAVFAADPQACQDARGVGACWGLIKAKSSVILWGRYPFAQQWRVQLSTVLLLLLIFRSSILATTTGLRKTMFLEWGAVLIFIFVLMSGYLGPFEFLRSSALNSTLSAPFIVVPTDLWGGLPLTLLLSFICIVLATPLALLLALARTSDMPLFKVISKTYIEVIRGVPLISVLFMASYMFPLLLPSGYSPDVLLRVILGISLFAAAYLAEIVRAGIQTIPKSQSEAASSIGFGYWHTQYLIILPQAIKVVIPGIMNSFISIFKDTSLITIVSLYELTGSLTLAMSGDALWLPYKFEGYLFITFIYFVFCFAMSRYSLWIERRLKRA
jgi:general L-amino acid transport system permease protein